MSRFRRHAPSPPWAALGVFLGLLAFLAAAGLRPALWHLAGPAAVLGVGVSTASLDQRRRDHTAHTAFGGS